MQYPNGVIIHTSNPEYHLESIQLSAKEGKQKYHKQIIDELKQWIKPGDTVWGKVNSVSRSGMSRNISFYIVKDNKICCIDWRVARVTENKQGKRGGVIISGCGMDMVFNVVYSLGCALWPDGTPEPHGMCNGEADSNGGYALKYAYL